METSKVKQLMKNKAHFHEALVRNGFYLPSLRSGVCTMEYLIGVRDKQIWSLQYSGLKIKPCPQAPSKHVLLDLVLETLTKNGVVRHGLVPRKKVPDKGWLLAVLATINPECKVFKKDYVAAADIQVVRVAPSDPLLPNDDHFYDGLPVLYRQKDVRGQFSLGRSGKVSKLALQRQRVAKAKARLTEMERQEALNAQEARRNQVEEVKPPQDGHFVTNVQLAQWAAMEKQLAQKQDPPRVSPAKSKVPTEPRHRARHKAPNDVEMD